ncbi:hypothetical protein K488DRAFT_92719 [Vararia minispora EC-137]|uniref:Uncharacterized protein n=1 Tax=Vararia minispora EC-137 TaxID=1314806 RepID=A0ACB8Q3R9_9AGAM|nr:hypothetical protein K488DRAFT_92719 [Vararia minispora EC-137]
MPPFVPGARTGRTRSPHAGAPDLQPHFHLSLLTLAPDVHPPYLLHGPVDRACHVLSPLASIPHSRPSRPTPALRIWCTDQQIAHTARRQLLLLSLVSDPRARHPPSVPGARTGRSRTPHTDSSYFCPSLLTPALHTWCTDRRIAHTTRQQLLLPSLAPYARPLYPAHRPAYYVRRTQAPLAPINPCNAALQNQHAPASCARAHRVTVRSLPLFMPQRH